MAKVKRKQRERLDYRRELYDQMVKRSKDGGKSLSRPGSQSRKKSFPIK